MTIVTRTGGATLRKKGLNEHLLEVVIDMIHEYAGPWDPTHEAMLLGFRDPVGTPVVLSLSPFPYPSVPQDSAYIRRNFHAPDPPDFPPALIAALEAIGESPTHATTMPHDKQHVIAVSTKRLPGYEDGWRGEFCFWYDDGTWNA
jgi:hypothetical protein